MPSCAFRKCTSHSSKKPDGISFHGFPKDVNNRQKWIYIIRQQRLDPDWTPTEYSRVCSKHFKTDHISTTSEGYKRTITEAMPYFQGMIIDDFSSEPVSQTVLQAKVKALENENKALKKKNKLLEEKCKSLKEALKNIVM